MSQRLLIADDNSDIVTAGRFLFEPEGFEVVGARSPRAVIAVGKVDLWRLGIWKGELRFEI